MDVCTRACSCMQRNPKVWDLKIFQKTPLGSSFVDDEENLLEMVLSCTELATGLYHQVHLFEHLRIVQFCHLHWQTSVRVQVWLDFSCTMNFSLVCWFKQRIFVLKLLFMRASLLLSMLFFSHSLFKSTSDRRVCTYHISTHIQITFSELETLKLKDRSEIWERTCTHRCLWTQCSSATHRWTQRWTRSKVKHCWPEESKWHLMVLTFASVQKAVPII